MHGTFGAMADDRVVFVTGGGSGIGRATAQRAAREGAAVAVVDRNGEGAAETAALVDAAGGRALALTVDVADDDAIGAAVAETVGTLGRVTGVVTAAGIFHGPDLQPLHQVTVETFQRVIGVNLQGTFSALRHTLPHLTNGGGSVVTIASTAAIRGHGYGAAYTASKGGVDTPMTAGTFSSPEAQARARRDIPVGRYAQPEDLADVIAFLLSDDARYVTGQTLPVEGGATIS